MHPVCYAPDLVSRTCLPLLGNLYIGHLFSAQELKDPDISHTPYSPDLLRDWGSTMGITRNCCRIEACTPMVQLDFQGYYSP